MKIIEKPKTPVSNVCYPKCDVHKQNEEIEAWMRKNPDKVTRIKEGQTFYKFKKLPVVS